MTIHEFDPELDLVLERTVDVAPELVWAAWTTPAHLVKWFAPAPWSTIDCKIDLRPGGTFSTTMRSPEGEEFPNEGCYLAVEPGTRLVWTSALIAGYRPAPSVSQPGLHFTAEVRIEPSAGGGTKYTALAMHPDPASKKQHEEMGFAEGWSTVFDQLVAMVRAL
jgi:uncharacterized protein YndB with AHSA1/START domain